MADRPIRWALSARRDMEALQDFIAAENPRAAVETVEQILAAVARLARFPLLGHAGRVPATRELQIPDLPYFVSYRLKAGDIEILAVIHRARRWP